MAGPGTLSGSAVAPEWRTLFDLAWNPKVAGKEEFRRELFRCRVRKSHLWPEIAAMNGRPAHPAEGICPAEDG